MLTDDFWNRLRKRVAARQADVAIFHPERYEDENHPIPEHFFPVDYFDDPYRIRRVEDLDVNQFPRGRTLPELIEGYDDTGTRNGPHSEHGFEKEESVDVEAGEYGHSLLDLTQEQETNARAPMNSRPEGVDSMLGIGAPSLRVSFKQYLQDGEEK